MDIIFSILALLFGIAFVCWGIYQIKTGKMVAKKRKNPIDEPREVGAIFIVLGLNLALYFAPYFYATFSTPLTDLWIFANEMAIFTATPLAILNTGFFLAIAIYAFKEHRILGLKSDKTTKKAIGKFLKPVAILSLLRALIFPLEGLIFIIPNFDFVSINFVEILVNVFLALEVFFRPILLIVICILYIVIYKQSRKVAKTRKK